jgi:pimeloyl-ACP methyl ester carboxylesterase
VAPEWQLASRRRGTGRPIVLLHGLGASSRYWDRLSDLLAPDSAVVAPDLLGFGRSPKPRDEAYDVECHLTGLVRLVPEGSILVGHSLGAVLAASLAARLPSVVSAAVLVGMPVYPDESTARREVARLGALARLTVDGSRWARVLCELMCALRPLAQAVAPLLIRDLPPEIVRDGTRHTWPSYSRTLSNVIVRHRVQRDLDALRVPTMLVHGDRDLEAPLHYAENAASVAKSSRAPVDFLSVDGDHHLPVRQPDVIAQTIKRRLGRS